MCTRHMYKHFDSHLGLWFCSEFVCSVFLLSCFFFLYLELDQKCCAFKESDVSLHSMINGPYSPCCDCTGVLFRIFGKYSYLQTSETNVHALLANNIRYCIYYFALKIIQPGPDWQTVLLPKVFRSCTHHKRGLFTVVSVLLPQETFWCVGR